MNPTALIEQWYESKKSFIRNFNVAASTFIKLEPGKDQLIYEFPEELSFPLDLQTRRSKVESFIDYINDLLYDWNVSSNTIVDLCQFIRANIDTFHENKVERPWRTINNDHIEVGMKLLKAFKFFLHGEILNNIQQMASVLIQESKVTGKFCISVHPLDYLSSSESTYNWRSCHALDGDYRAGNLAYMTDTCTVVCYLRGNSKEKLPRFPASVPWNSKKWRMLLFVSSDELIYYAGRQYPFESDNILNFVRKEVLPVITGIPFSWNNYWTVQDNYSQWVQYAPTELIQSENGDNRFQAPYTRLNQPYLYIKGELYRRRDLIKSKNTLFYNDLLASTKYIPSYCWSGDRFNDSYRPETMVVGEDPVCPCCGTNSIDFSDEMICTDCDSLYGTQVNDEFVFCYGCSDRLYRDDARYDEDVEEYFCEDCYYNRHDEENYY